MQYMAYFPLSLTADGGRATATDLPQRLALKSIWNH
jgi:hypothetical protein